MKFLVVIALFALPILAFSQPYPEKYKDYPNDRFGLAYQFYDEIRGSYYDTITPPIYKDIIELNGQFLLIKDEIQKVGKETYSKNGQVVKVKDKTITPVKTFQLYQYNYHDHLITEKKGDTYALYDPKAEKYLIEKFNSLKRFHQCTGCESLYSAIIDNRTVVYNRRGEEMFSSTIIGHFDYDASLKLFSQGEKLKTYFDEKGNIVFKDITAVENLCPRVTEVRYYQLTKKDKTTHLYSDGKVIIKDFKGSFVGDMLNMNRIIAKTAEGYIVFDATGKRINNEVYESLQPAVKNESGKDVNLVKKAGSWFFVDENYKPIEDISYFNAMVVGELRWSNNYYAVQSTKAQKGFNIYNSEGKPISTDLYEEAYFADYYQDALILKKDGLLAICTEGKPGEFKYQSVENLEEFLSEGYYICQLPGKPSYYVLYDYYSQTEYFTDWKLSRISTIAEQDDDKWIILIYDENDKFQLVNMYATRKDQIVKSGSFEFDNYYFDQERGYDEPILFVQKNGLWGIYRTDTLYAEIPCQYDKIYWNDYEFLDYYLLKTEKNGKQGLLKTVRGKYEEILAPTYDEIVIMDEVLITQSDKKYGVIDSQTGSVMAPPVFIKKPTYDALFNDDLGYRQAALVNNVQKECILKGAYSQNPQFMCFENLTSIPGNDDMMTFDHNGKKGVISVSLDTVLVPLFDHVEQNADFDYWLTSIDGKKGMRTWQGEIILKEEFEELITDKEFYTNIILLKKEGKWAAYLREDLKTPFDYETLELRDDFIFAKKDGKWGLLTHTFETYIEFKYSTKEEVLKAISEE
ncbi:MAG: hypothetical protein H6582_04500 [Crocinitomicaceae bacterium]|nr:hypothetical protein [Crocinitomicaceae bacterium]